MLQATFYVHAIDSIQKIYIYWKNVTSLQSNVSPHQLSPNSKGAGGIVDRWHLRRCREGATETQVPHRVVVHSWQIFGDGDSDRAVLLGESVLELDLLVIVDGVEIAHRVVVQPDTVLAAGILGQRIGTVAGGCSVETQVNGGTGGDGRVVGNALEDVDA